MIVYGSKEQIEPMLMKYDGLGLAIEKIIAAEKDSEGEVFSYGLPSAENEIVLLSLPPKTYIYLTDDALELRVRQLRQDLRCMNLSEHCRKKELDLARRARVKLAFDHKPHIFWGAKNFAIRGLNPKPEADMLVDEDEHLWGTVHHGLPVSSTDVVTQHRGQHFLVVMVNDYSRIRKFLLSKGLHEYDDFAHYSMLYPNEDREFTRVQKDRQRVCSLIATGPIPKVSVVMPSLNVCDYIRQAVESVQAQYLKELEIICVDAGSTDGTLEILEELAAGDSRIRVLRSPVKSYGYQVNMGFKAAKGEYIGIVETDDWILPNMYLEEYIVAKSNDLDVLKASFYKFRKEGLVREEHDYIAEINAIGQRKHYGKVLCPYRDLFAFDFQLHIWSGLYKREFIDKYKIRCNESPGAAYQDNGLWFQTMMYASRYMCLENAYYMLRRDRAGSSCFNHKAIDTIAREYEFIKEKVEEFKPGIFMPIYLKMKYSNYVGSLSRVEAESRLDLLHKYAEEFRADTNCYDIPDTIWKSHAFSIMQQVAEDVTRFYRDMVVPRIEFEEALASYHDVIIYGTKGQARNILRMLIYNDDIKEIIACAVPEVSRVDQDVLGIPVYGLNMLTEYKNHAVVIVTNEYPWRKKNELEADGWLHVLRAPVNSY